METIRAKWFHAGRLKAIRLIVIHCTVSPEYGDGAESVARYFAAGERRASTHRVVDNNSTVLCVNDEDTAFGAAGANSDGLHLELVGQPTQTVEDWKDRYSTAEMMQAGLSIREWSREHSVPMRWLTVAQLADGKTKGICTHHDVSRAFPDVSTGHWDPGPNFPKDWALGLWTPQDEPPHGQEDDDMGRIIYAPGRPTVLADAGVWKALKSNAEVDLLVKIGHKKQGVTAAEFDRLAAIAKR